MKPPKVYNALLLLTAVFFLLRVSETVSWSWWLVFCPLWVPVAVATGLLALVAAVILAVLVASITINLVDR